MLMREVYPPPSRESGEQMKLAFGPSSTPGKGSISFPPADEYQTPKSGNKQRTWWVHLWSGLVRDPTGKHQKAMKQAVWLYLYLLVGANWKTGLLFRRIATMAKETSSNARTVQRWLGTLRRKGYIKTIANGRALKILITKWRPISRKGRP